MERNANRTATVTLLNVPELSSSEMFLKSKSLTNIDSDPDMDVENGHMTADSDPVASITIKTSLTPGALKDLLVGNTSVKFLTFHGGLTAEKPKLDFHQPLALPKLRKLTFRIPADAPISSQSPPIPHEFKRLFHFLKLVEYTGLESVELICSPDRGICIPLFSAVIPCYELEDSSPLMDLIRTNRKTIKSIAIGHPQNRFYLKLNPELNFSTSFEQSCTLQLEVFKGFPNYPLLPSWSKMLQPQKHLTKLYIAFNDPAVWGDVSEAILLSSNSLMTVKLKAFGTEPGALNLEVLKSCRRLTHFALRYFGLKITGWESLPLSIKQLTLAGPLKPIDTRHVSRALQNVECIYFILKPMYMEETKISAPVNVHRHPMFELFKSPPPSFREFALESTDITLDMVTLRRWTELQPNLKLVEKSDKEFFVVRETSSEEKVPVITPKVEDEEAEEESPMCFGCGTLGW